MILLLEPTGGIAGDMFLAAALDLGVSRQELERILASLKLPGWRFEVSKAQRHGITGTHLDVVIESAAPAGVIHDHSHENLHAHSHAHPAPHLDPSHFEYPVQGAPPAQPHAHVHSGHSQDHTHSHPHSRPSELRGAHADERAPQDSTVRLASVCAGANDDDELATNQGHHPHGHRPLSEIQALIHSSGLPDGAKKRALEVFRVIGEAESKIHDIPIDQIAFHEVGAVDSIVDICGAAVVLELLGNPEVFATAPPLGSGTVKIAHGVVPVPVPATLEILRGSPVLFEGTGELTTPTGAALLKTFATIGPLPGCTIEKIGYGVGTKDWPDRANVLRASLGHRAGDEATAVQVIEANLDDCSPQLLGALIDTLMKQGALDAWVVPATMKKGRPGHLLSVMATEASHRALIATVLAESTSLGIRSHRAERTVLARRFEEVSTPWGKVRIKLGLQGQTVINAAPEFDDCRLVAESAHVPLKQVLSAAMAAWESKRQQ